MVFLLDLFQYLANWIDFFSYFWFNDAYNFKFFIYL